VVRWRPLRAEDGQRRREALHIDGDVDANRQRAPSSSRRTAEPKPNRRTADRRQHGQGQRNAPTSSRPSAGRSVDAAGRHLHRGRAKTVNGGMRPIPLTVRGRSRGSCRARSARGELERDRERRNRLAKPTSSSRRRKLRSSSRAGRSASKRPLPSGRLSPRAPSSRARH
jgi:hypothetical protein